VSSEEDWFDNPDYLNDYFDGSDEGIDCDYGLTEFCDNPDLRSVNCCFECDTYLEACAEEAGERDFALFWLRIERDQWEEAA